MVNRCDSVDALMYAYYVFMRNKEENQMLKKNKDYVEFTLQYTSVDWARSKDRPEVCLKGYSDFSFPGVPIMDVVCNEFDHKVVVVSKRDFERLQADNQHYRELAKQLEHNYGLLLSMTGFNDLEDLTNYIHDAGKNSKGDWKTIKEIADITEKDYISERDKAEALQTENEQLKKKLEEFSPAPGYEEFLKALYPEATEATIGKLVWTTGQLCCGRDLPNALLTDLEYYRAISSAQAKYIGCWQEATGCSTPEEAKELIDCKKRRIIELKDELDNSLSTNEELKKKLAVPDPFAEYKELLEKLHSKEDVEKFEWTLNHICGGKASANGWMVTAKLWRRNYETLSKLIGFSSVEEIQDYLTNEAECDTLQEAISKLKDQVKYTCDEWYSANSSNNSWKAAAECNSPKELIEKLSLLRDDISGRSTVIESYKRDIEKWQKATGCLRPEDISIAGLSSKCMLLEKEIEVYSRTLKEWKETTGCPSPSAAKALIESGMVYEHGYHEAQEENRKLTEEIDSWKNVTGYSTPEDYMHARINNATPFDYTAAWQDATGCVTPDQVKSRIEGLENAVRLTNRNMIKEIESNIDEWQKFTGCDSPQKAGRKINDLCDDICKLKGDYDRLLELTGYKNEKSICAALVFSDENHLYITMRDLINSLKRKAKFTESNWQKATGFESPEKFLKWKTHIEEIMKAWKDRTECKYPVEAEELLERWKTLTKCETPEAAATWITSYEKACERGNRLAQDIEAWKKATGCDTPEMAEGEIKYYHSRLGNAVQAASCAAKHLENIMS